MRISYSVCAHMSRVGNALDIANSLDAALTIDDGTLGSLRNHDLAWEMAYERGGDWCVVLEDDITLVNNFDYHVRDALRNIPDPMSSCSLYVGTGKPQPERIEHVVRKAERLRASWLVESFAIWGPALALPREMVPVMLDFVRSSHLPYDNRLSEYLKAYGVSCYYTFPSLVDHLDGSSLITEHISVSRKAHVAREPMGWDGPTLELLTGKVL